MCDLIVNKSAYNKSLITFWTDLVHTQCKTVNEQHNITQQKHS